MVEAYTKLVTFGIGLAITFAIGTAIGFVEHQALALVVSSQNVHHTADMESCSTC